jgi:uncharacterized membrane protein YuzA (DUF378 family)
MEMLKRLEPLALVVMVLGALNWGAIGLFDENVIANVFGTGTFTDVLYAIVGVAGLVYVPKVLEGLHIGAGPHPRGA